MSRDGIPVYRRQYTAVDYLLAALLFVIAALIFFSATGVAFEKTGFTQLQFIFILGAALVGSYVDIPVWRITSSRPVVVLREVRAFWVTYRIPAYSMAESTTTIALNVGGALIPIAVSLYLVSTHPGIWFAALIATALTAIAVHMVARYIEGVGVVSPTILPPLAAVLFSVPFAGSYLAITAYVAGTAGTLIGADLSNLRKISRGGTHVASIGGAGKFDGIFLTGVVAVLIASLV